VDLLETSIGHGWAKGPRNSPTVLNAVFNLAQFWDGRAKDLQEQAKGPVQAAVEMNSTPDRAVSTLISMPGYVAAFERAFPTQPNPVTFDNMALAIEAFESTLLTPWSDFDRYLSGQENALDADELSGLGLFMSKGCVNCHSGVNVGGTGYFSFGVVEQPGAEILPVNDKGRFEVTKTASDEYKFKSPSLRNIELTAPYFHSGKVWDLKQAVAVMGASQLGADLNDSEVDAIVAFLRTLTGTQPKVEVPILPPHTEQTPLPESGPTAGANR
jgi:cytochrome c peroxidase